MAVTFALLLITAVVFLIVGAIGGMKITQNNQAKATEFNGKLNAEFNETASKLEKALNDWAEKLK